MSTYHHDWIKGLERQLTVSPPAVRRKHADRIEALLSSLEPDKEYSREFIYFRITGFRPDSLPIVSHSGKTLRRDLASLLERVSQTAPSPAEEAPGVVLSTEDVAEELGVSPRTVLRWRDKGLVCRKYVFSDGGTRLGVRRNELDRFVRRHRQTVARSSRFSRVSEDESDEIRRLARSFARDKDLSTTALAERVASQTDRALETVRRILKEGQSGGKPGSGALDRDEKQRIFDAYRDGRSADSLATRFDRSRSTVYRIINECRARQLLADQSLPARYVLEPEFKKPDAERLLAPLPEDPGERDCFRLYNFLKYRLTSLKEEINPKRYVPTDLINRVETHQWAARSIRHNLVHLRLPLIVDIARQHSGEIVTLAELLPEAYQHCLRAVDGYDYRERNEFTAFAKMRLLKAFARTVPEANYVPSGRNRSTERERHKALKRLREQMQTATPPTSGPTAKRARRRFGLQCTSADRSTEWAKDLLDIG